ncbi:unnamed protein product [Brassica oleracea var. botrytis]
MDSVKGRDISGCYTINGFAQALQVWVYTALPELGATFGNPLPNNPSPSILAYKGRKGRIQFKEAILSQTRVINFIQKDTGEMFPKWEFDVEDPLAENIIKLMFVKKPWKLTMDCWEVTGTWVNTKSAVVGPAKKKVVKEDSPRPRKKARKEAPAEASEEAAAEASEEAAAEASEEVTTTVGGLTKEDIKTMFKDIADAMREGFGTCLKEIKYLSERVEAVEKKVGITTKRKGTSSQNTTSPPKPTLEPGLSNKSLDFIYSESVNGTNAGRKSLAEDKAPEPSLVLLDKNQSTVSDLQKEDARYLEKKDAALALCRAKSDRTRKLVRSQKSPYTANRTARVIISNRKLYPGYNPFAPIDKNKLRELAEWLKSCLYYRTALDKKPRKSRTRWYQILRTSLEWLEDCHIDAWINVLRKRYNANPQHFRSERMCFLDHLFAQQWRFNFKDFKDSKPDQNGLGRRLPEELDVVMEPFLYMVPYLLVECASSDELRAQYSLEPFTYERPTNIPPARAGDCGVYTLKYIECHALGIEFSKKDFAKANGKSMRDKMAVDIFQELPDAHEFENKDMDDILGTYDG